MHKKLFLTEGSLFIFGVSCKTLYASQVQVGRSDCIKPVRRWISYEFGQHVLWLATADIGRLLIFQVEGSFESEECNVITFDGFSPTTYWKFSDQKEQRKYTLHQGL